MREEKRRSREEDVTPLPKKKRYEDSPLHNQCSSKPRGYIPMSERQQFALLRQMETEESGIGGESAHTPSSISPLGVNTCKESSGLSHGQHHHDDSTPHSNMCRAGYSHEYLSDESRLCESEACYSTSHNCGANRERSAISTGSFPSVVKTPPNLSRLFTLTKSGDLETLKQLVKEGVDVNEQDERGRTALHEFSTRSLPRLVAYLLRHGAQPNISALNGDTALHEAAKVGNVRIVRTLLRHNADPLVLNSRGERPVDVCENSEMLAILNQ
ncbi:uncharacterized protein DEA37_0002771, partial [Paragonimus westermani]